MQQIEKIRLLRLKRQFTLCTAQTWYNKRFFFLQFLACLWGEIINVKSTYSFSLSETVKSCVPSPDRWTFLRSWREEFGLGWKAMISVSRLTGQALHSLTPVCWLKTRTGILRAASRDEPGSYWNFTTQWGRLCPKRTNARETTKTTNEKTTNRTTSLLFTCSSTPFHFFFNLTYWFY